MQRMIIRWLRRRDVQQAICVVLVIIAEKLVNRLPEE